MSTFGEKEGREGRGSQQACAFLSKNKETLDRHLHSSSNFLHFCGLENTNCVYYSKINRFRVKCHINVVHNVNAKDKH